MRGTTKPSTAPKREFIAFRAGGQEFCLDVMAVREIRGWTMATPLPQAPEFVRGVINLRGTVLSIVDLAARLGFPPAEPTARNAIMVAHSGEQTAGFLVESVSDIFTVSEAEIQPTPAVASELAQRFVRGVMVLDGRLISIISVEAVLPPAEKAAA